MQDFYFCKNMTNAITKKRTPNIKVNRLINSSKPLSF